MEQLQHHFIVEIALLLSAAFFIGYFIGMPFRRILRRSFSTGGMALAGAAAGAAGAAAVAATAKAKEEPHITDDGIVQSRVSVKDSGSSEADAGSTDPAALSVVEADVSLDLKSEDTLSETGVANAPEADFSAPEVELADVSAAPAALDIAAPDLGTSMPDADAADSLSVASEADISAPEVERADVSAAPAALDSAAPDLGTSMLDADAADSLSVASEADISAPEVEFADISARSEALDSAAPALKTGIDSLEIPEVESPVVSEADLATDSALAPAETSLTIEPPLAPGVEKFDDAGTAALDAVNDAASDRPDKLESATVKTIDAAVYDGGEVIVSTTKDIGRRPRHRWFGWLLD